MKKPFILLIVLLLALTACNSASKSGSEPVAEATPTAEPTVAPTPVPPTATAADSSTSGPVAAPTPEAPGCYADSIASLIDLKPNTDIAAVGASDPWQSGGDITAAAITVVEYGDFQ